MVINSGLQIPVLCASIKNRPQSSIQRTGTPLPISAICVIDS
jgi:hypothetical protein